MHNRRHCKILRLSCRRFRHLASSGGSAPRPPAADSPSPERPSSAPDGARSPDLFGPVLDHFERQVYAQAAGITALDADIAFLRTKAISTLCNDPHAHKTVQEYYKIITGLYEVRFSLTKDDRKGLAEAVRTAVKEFGIPLGINLLTKKL